GRRLPMTLRSRVRNLFARTPRRAPEGSHKAPAATPRVRWTRPCLEVLEERCVLTTWYVNAAATGSNNGRSWTNADTDLQKALGSAQSGDQIWVAQGTYKPTSGTDRSLSFALKAGVAIYGGFAGGETLLSQRDFVQHVTTLSGDIGTPGDSGDNSYHV